MESLAIVPQLIVLQRYREVENLTAHYVFLLGIYRALYIINWIYRSYHETYYKHNYVAYFCAFVQTCLYLDFFYYYFLRWDWYNNNNYYLWYCYQYYYYYRYYYCFYLTTTSSFTATATSTACHDYILTPYHYFSNYQIANIEGESSHFLLNQRLDSISKSIASVRKNESLLICFLFDIFAVKYLLWWGRWWWLWLLCWWWWWWKWWWW